jgi:hypothetical protein
VQVREVPSMITSPRTARELTEVEESNPALATDLLRLRELLERMEIDAARSWIEELVERWPESERVRHYAHVLAPPTTRTIPGDRGRPLDSENAWLRAHAHEHPG